jgi:signal transduction histidine kinase
VPLRRMWSRMSVAAKVIQADEFDAPAEWVIAQGRLFLCGLSLMAVFFEPPVPAQFASATYAMLISYFAYAVGVVAATHWRLPDPASARGIHAADVLATSLLLFLTDGPTSPFFAFFTFILLAAALRWSWQGVLTTFGVLLIAFVGSSVTQSETLPEPPIAHAFRGTVIGAAYLAVIAAMLAYVSVYRERTSERLAKLAEWPAYAMRDEDLPGFASILAHAANVLGAPRVVTIWEEGEEPFLKTASWAQGSYQNSTEPAEAVADLVPPALMRSAFATDNVAFNVVLLPAGHISIGTPLKISDVLRRFSIVSMATAPFTGSICRGRVFVLDRTGWTGDHLLLMEIVASRMAIELDRQVLQAQAQDAAAMRERIRLARDLHDGILQSLAAAGLQLKLAGDRLNKGARSRIDTAKGLLASEQRRIREYVQAMRPKPELPGDVMLSHDLAGLLAETARSWNCALSFFVEPDDAMVSRKMAAQLSLMLPEAIANAVRHGKASQLGVTVRKADDGLTIVVRDNGSGFGAAASNDNDSGRSAPNIKPASLLERVGELGGSLEVVSSSTGAELRIRLPTL